MAFPTWNSIYQQVINRLDDPNGQVFTPAVFQPGFNEAYDVLFNSFLNSQAPRVEFQVFVTVTPGTTQLTPAQMGISDFGDYIFISEQPLGSNARFRDLTSCDRLPQYPPGELLRWFNYRAGTFYFIGATQAINLQVRYDTSGVAPVSDGSEPSNAVQICVDASQNFLANYTTSVIGQRKGYDEIAQDCRGIAVGPRYNMGVPGGQLFSLLQPLVRSRQNVQVAPKPYTANRRLSTGWPAPYIPAQQGSTGGGVQNVPIQYSTANSTIVPAPDGSTTVFVLVTGVTAFAVVSLNGVTLTPGYDYSILGNQITMLLQTPQPGDVLTAEAYPVTQM